jgi:hypothetical protein
MAPAYDSRPRMCSLRRSRNGEETLTSLRAASIRAQRAVSSSRVTVGPSGSSLPIPLIVPVTGATVTTCQPRARAL